MNWLARLKNSKAPRGYATETTKTQRVGAEGVSVVFVAPLSGGFQKFDGGRQGVDAGGAARLVASSEEGLDHAAERASDHSTTGDQSHHGAKAIAAATTPLVQEKILKAPGTHATETTKRVSVVFVAPLSGVSGNSHPARACRDCSHRLAPGTCGEPVQAGLRDHFSIVWPDPAHAQSCPAYTARPVTPKTWDHAPASDAELRTMSERQARFEMLGLPYEEAGRAADVLLLRDRDEGADRRLCLECHHLRGRPGAWRCPAPGGMPAPLVAQLQRCPALKVAP